MPTIKRLKSNNEPTDRKKLRQRLYRRTDYRQARDWYKREHIWCSDCLKKGKYTPGRDLHHILSPFDNNLTEEQRIHRLLDVENWVYLCEDCHQKRHERQKRKSDKPLIYGRDMN